MQERAACQAQRISRRAVRPAVARDDVVARNSRTTGIVNLELRVVENVEPFKAQLERVFLVDRNVLYEGRVEIEPSRIVHRIATGVAESKALRRDVAIRVA